MDLGSIPSWVSISITILAVVFGAGALVGVLRMVQGGLKDVEAKVGALVTVPESLRILTDNVSRLATAREEQIATVVEHRVQIQHMHEEMDKMRRAHHDLRNDFAAYGAKLEAKLSRLEEDVKEAHLAAVGRRAS